MKNENNPPNKKILLIAPLLFSIIVTLIFIMRKEQALLDYDQWIQTVPSIKNYGQNVALQFKDGLAKYGLLIGAALGLIYFAIGITVQVVFSILQINRWRLGRILGMMLALTPLLYFGGNLVYVSSRFTALSAGIVLLFGYPLFYASIITMTLLILWLIRKFLQKGKVLLVAITCSVLLSGCTDLLNLFIEFSCDESDYHCQQEVAVGSNDPDECDKITQHPNFNDSNPPKDKCYLMVAQNNNEPEICDRIKGGPGSYNIGDCKTEVAKTPSVVDIPVKSDEEANEIANASDGLSDSKVREDLNQLAGKAIDKYNDLLSRDIENEIDESRLAGLEAYQNFLNESGETIDSIQGNIDKFNELKRIFLDSYDPSMDIANMDVNDILGPGFFDRVKSRLFGESNEPQTEEEQASDALTVYAAMLERQAEIDFLKQNRLNRLGSVITDNLKGKAVEQVQEGAINVAKGVTGTAFTAVTFVGDAVQSFAEEGQNETFIGLARAYNRRRDALTKERPNATPDELHQATIAQLKEDPYRDAQGLTVIKYGNVLENGECGSTNNPLCIQSEVFFTAMEQTWRYKNK